MPRYFLELAYKGAGYAGFQVQRHARTIQGDVNKALSIIVREDIKTTGSSRTDAGVHALQNFVHFDASTSLPKDLVYKMNAVLSPQIAVRHIFRASDDAHARFDAVKRSYFYRIYWNKDPFMQDGGYFYPYPLKEDLLYTFAQLILTNNDFTSFSKRKTQVKTFLSTIAESRWERSRGQIIFHITANRFLRGMVRGIVGTMLKVSRANGNEEDFRKIVLSKDNRMADFSVPPQGLFLKEIRYPEGLLLPFSAG